MSATTCPRCGKEARGNFCSWCGAALGGRHCTECGAETEPGARFCNRCGSPLAEGMSAPSPGGGASRKATSGAGPSGGAGPASGGGSQTGWWVAGAVLVVLILIVAYPVLRQDEVARSPGASAMAPAAGGGQAPGAGPSSVDLSSMTPREAADMLYDRVMRAASAGDTAQVTGFLPMAIAAYDRARPLDADGFFHMALLQQTGGDFEAALATAREGLEADPDHLLLLAAAAEAAQGQGDEATAREYYEHLLDVWDDEQAKGLEEYQPEVHGSMLPGLRQEALDFLGR